MARGYIEFDNLVQADSNVAGKSQPVRAEKTSGSIRKYAQANASGELYQPTGLDDVMARAQKAGKRFRKTFSDK